MRHGTTQQMRRLAALRPESAPLDERTIPDGLVFASKFARLINYFDRDDRLAGDWSAFFDEQPLVQYALIDAIDLAGLAEYYTEVLEQLLKKEDKAGAETTPTPEAEGADEGVERTLGLPVVLESLLAIFQRANGWHRFFAGRPEEKVFFDAVDAAIRMGMAPALRVGSSFVQGEDLGSPLLFGRRAWKTAARDLDPALWAAGTVGGEEASLKQLGDALWEAHRAEARLVTVARGRMAVLLAQPEGLDPHFALFLNFLRQYGKAQARLNGLTGRHLDFYYRTILEESPLPARPDRIYFALQTDPKRGRFTLPAGAGLTGKDGSGQPVVYQTDEPLELSGAALAEIRTLSLTPPAEKAPAHFEATTILNADSKTPPPSPEPWAPFGEKPGQAAGGATASSGIGFAIASPYLHLEEGISGVKLTLTCHAKNDSGFGDAPVTGPLLPSSFELTYSGPASWESPTRSGGSFSLGAPAGGGTRELALTLSIGMAPGAAACVNFDASKLEGAFAPDWPVLRVRFPNPLADLTAKSRQWNELLWAALAEARLETIGIAVRAHHMTDLALYSDAIPLTPGAGMLLFGYQPRPGSAFYVGKPEMGRKKFHQVTLRLDWANLPGLRQYPRGWADYYRGYADALESEGLAETALSGELFGNREYQVTLACRSGREWRGWPPARGVEQWYPLFQTRFSPPAWQSDAAAPGRYYRPAADPEPDAPLRPSTTYCGRGALLEAPSYRPPAGPARMPPLATGFLRVQLVAPEYGFGQQMYPQVASATALQNAQVLMRETPTRPLDPIEVIVEELKWPAPRPLWAPFGPPQFVLMEKLMAILDNEPALSAELASGSALPGLSPDQWAAAQPPFRKALLALRGQRFTDRYALDQLIFGLVEGVVFEKGKEPLNWAAPAAQGLLVQIYRWFAALMHLPPADSGTRLQIDQGPKAVLPMPNPPLIPALLGVELGYRASTTIDLAKESEPYGFYHLTPWAAYPVAPPSPGPGESPATLLESFPAGGYLYLGLANVSPPQALTLLAVVSDPPVAGFEEEAAAPAWSYLMSHGWSPPAPLPEGADGTFGFQVSGLIKLALPAGMSAGSPLMPAGRFWLRAHVPPPARTTRVVQLSPQAGSATWQIPEAASPASIDLHLAAPLPPLSIRAAVPPRPLLLGVAQPLPSFDGRAVETAEQLVVRVSERLRHKNRAWTPWDYERLLLQQFPEIFYALCLPSTKHQDSECPGHVLVLVLPVLASPPANLPPGFTAGPLRAMEQWLRERISPSVQVAVANPAWQTVRVIVQVAFALDQPEAVYRRQLNEDLKAFISPWIYRQASLDGPPAMTFHPVELRGFVRGRPYVRHVRSVEIEGLGTGTKADDRLTPSEPWNLLLTAAHHVIQVIRL